ncbi:MAG: hypothetical protein WAM39_13070 [Bryobacteraceae bacterium]
MGDEHIPIVWPCRPESRNPDLTAPWVTFAEQEPESSIIGVVWGVDHRGEALLRELVAKGMRIKLVVAAYPASPTDQGVLEKLFQLANSSNTRADFALSACAIDGNAASMTALLILKPSGGSLIWVGNTPNFGCKLQANGHLNIGFEPDEVLTGRFIESFADLWAECAPLTPQTAAVPPLVQARGSEEAAEAWTSYERLCDKLSAPEATEGDRNASAALIGTAEANSTPLAKICEQLKIALPDRLKERVFRLLALGEVVTIDKSTRTPPLELPVRAEWFGGEAETVGVISRRSSYRIRIFDEDQSKDLQARRNGLSDLIQRLTYPLADGVRWIPKKAQCLLERERARLENEARDLINGLVGDSASQFAKSRREAIERDADEMYKKVCPGTGKLPTRTLNLILRDLEVRLSKATQGDFLPRVTYMSTQLSGRGDSEHVAQWAQPRTLLAAIAEYSRKAVTTAGHLKGLEIPEDELLPAMDVCDDWVLRERGNSKTDRAAKAELSRLQQIQESEVDDRTKCELMLALMEHRSSSEQAGYSRGVVLTLRRQTRLADL